MFSRSSVYLELILVFGLSQDLVSFLPHVTNTYIFSMYLICICTHIHAFHLFNIDKCQFICICSIYLFLWIDSLDKLSQCLQHTALLYCKSRIFLFKNILTNLECQSSIEIVRSFCYFLLEDSIFQRWLHQFISSHRLLLQSDTDTPLSRVWSV